MWREILDNDAWNSFDNFSDGAAITNLSDYLIPSMSLNKIYDEFFWQNFGWIVFKGNKGKAINRNTLAEKVPGVNLESSLAVVQLADEQYAKMESPVMPDKPAIKKETANNIRKNFNETAFFFPDLHTNDKGEIEFSFTIPEALTRWKFQALAHTKDLALGYSSKEIVTTKDLMVQPNAPRFLREGDQISFSSKVVNLLDKELSGTAIFQLFDTETNKSVDDIFKNTSFNLKGKESKALQFPIEVPENFTKTLTWRIVAKSGSHSDGEENFLPVLSNRILVTETLPLSIKGKGSIVMG